VLKCKKKGFHRSRKTLKCKQCRKGERWSKKQKRCVPKKCKKPGFVRGKKSLKCCRKGKKWSKKAKKCIKKKALLAIAAAPAVVTRVVTF